LSNLLLLLDDAHTNCYYIENIWQGAWRSSYKKKIISHYKVTARLSAEDEQPRKWQGPILKFPAETFEHLNKISLNYFRQFYVPRKIFSL